ncbi:MAG: 4Fe-4S binding protein, partial [Candidatus Omnitrophica bacterium]|nr:4Fe-4S binding protein [Candidatus Omnitrophota bacterium]
AKALFKGPYTSKFPYQPHKPKERFRGKPEFHSEDCIGCTACIQVCPCGALSYRDYLDTRILAYKLEFCIFCGQCQSVCPTQKGITLSNKFDLADFCIPKEEKIEKKLVLCEGCGKVIAPYEQLLWLAKKLGPLCYSNPTLMLFYLKEINLAELRKTKERDLLRQERIGLLCPYCRRKVVIIS